MAGKAAGARVEASRMSPIHLTAMQGVVLRGEGQWLPFLEGKDDKKNVTLNQPEAFMMHISQKVSKTSLSLHRKTSPKCEGRAHQSVLGVDGGKGTMLAQMGGVAQHRRKTRLNHRPGRAPWIRGRVEAFCQQRRREPEG